MRSQDDLGWLYDTSAKNVLRHFGWGLAAWSVVAIFLLVSGIPSTGATGGPLIAFGCAGLYGVGMAAVLGVRGWLARGA